MIRIITTIFILGVFTLGATRAPAGSDAGGLLASDPSEGQDATPASGGTGTYTALPHQRDALGSDVSAADFVAKAGMDGMTEVRVAKIALQKAQSANVRQFAQQMASDHSKANDELKGIAAKKHLEVPAQLDPDHRMRVEALEGASDSAFDAAYISQMATAHDNALALFNSAKGSSDPDIAAFATRTLPTLQMHKQMVVALQTTARSAK